MALLLSRSSSSVLLAIYYWLRLNYDLPAHLQGDAREDSLSVAVRDGS